MKVIRPSPADVRTWTGAVRSIGNACGSGVNGDDGIGLDGHLWCHVGIDHWLLVELWRKGQLGTENPESAWHHLHEHKKFFVDCKGYRIRTGLFSNDKWLLVVGFLLGGIGDPSPKRLQVANIGFFGARSIVELFDSVDELLNGKWPLKDDAETAIRGC